LDRFLASFEDVMFLAASIARGKDIMAATSVPRNAICTVCTAGPTSRGRMESSGGNMHTIKSIIFGMPSARDLRSTPMARAHQKDKMVRTTGMKSLLWYNPVSLL
jgi:hypothetical protein